MTHIQMYQVLYGMKMFHFPRNYLQDKYKLEANDSKSNVSGTNFMLVFTKLW